MEWENRSSCIFIRCYPGKAESTYNVIKEWDNTIGVFLATGTYDIIAWIDTKDVKDTYSWVSKIRTWPEVEWTSTQQTLTGYRNETGYWEKPACGWFKVRTSNSYTTCEELNNCEHVAYYTSTTGDYDWVGFFYGENYNEIFNFMYELKSKGYEIEYYPTPKYYWNTNYQNKWESITAENYQTQT